MSSPMNVLSKMSVVLFVERIKIIEYIRIVMNNLLPYKNNKIEFQILSHYFNNKFKNIITIWKGLWCYLIYF